MPAATVSWLAAVAGESERGVGERGDESAMADLETVQHVGAHGHRQPRIARPDGVHTSCRGRAMPRPRRTCPHRRVRRRFAGRAVRRNRSRRYLPAVRSVRAWRPVFLTDRSRISLTRAITSRSALLSAYAPRLHIFLLLDFCRHRRDFQRIAGVDHDRDLVGLLARGRGARLNALGCGPCVNPHGWKVAMPGLMLSRLKNSPRW